ncbi:hypothetical protein F5887DRAFT_1077021 [Amanita rubescens]|nr:hypothetical protein F5887DRAFT_1077021 [Amanita rubescens]
MAYNPISSQANALYEKMKKAELAHSNDNEPSLFRRCIYISNSWRAAHIVPVPLTALTKGPHTPVNGHEEGSAFKLAYETWIKRPVVFEGSMDIKEWHLIVKEAHAYTLFYYATKILKHKDCGFSKEYVQMVGDVLFAKRVNDTLVDVEDEDVFEVLKLPTLMASLIYADDFTCRVLGDMIQKDQHYFLALFYGVGCSNTAVVPIPLAASDNDFLWDFSVWLTEPGNAVNIHTKDIVVSTADRKLHCVVYYVRQSTASEQNAWNKMLSDKFRSWYGNVLCQFGVYVYNGWKSAYSVPILVRADAPCGSSGISKHDVDYWITKPADIMSRTWVRVCKEYKTCAVVYYASIPVTPEGRPGHIPLINEMKIEDVGDVLYVKIVEGKIVDVEDEEINDVLRNIVRYL